MKNDRIISSAFIFVFGFFAMLLVILYIASAPFKSQAASNTLTVRIKIQGNRKQLDRLKTRIAFYHGSEKSYEESDVIFTYQSGVFVGDISFKPDFEFGNKYALFIKPEKYNGRLFCSEKIYGAFCTNPQFVFLSGGNIIDLTDQLFFSGDTEPADGKIDALDISRIMKNLGSMENRSTDLNDDGITDIVDYSLALYSLSYSVRDDEIHINIPPIVSPTLQITIEDPTVYLSPGASAQPSPTPAPTNPPPTHTPYPTLTLIPSPTPLPRLGKNCVKGTEQVTESLKSDWGLNVLPIPYRETYDEYFCVPVEGIVLHWSDSIRFSGNSATWGTLNTRNRVCGLAIDDKETLQMSNFYDDKVTWEGCSPMHNSINIEINGTEFDLWYNKNCEIVNPTANSALDTGELQEKKEAVASRYSVSPDSIDWENPRYEEIMKKQEKKVLDALHYLFLYYDLTKDDVTGHNRLSSNRDPGERFLNCIIKKL